MILRPHHNGPRPVMERFWEKVDLSGGLFGCWPWLAAIGKDGYGVFWMGDRQLKAHKAAYTLLHEPIADGLVPDHLCHNDDSTCPGGACIHRACVNPWHMEAVSVGVNVLRGRTISARNAAKTRCPSGHPYAGDNLRVVSGVRTCIECARASSRRSYDRHRDRRVEYARKRRAS